MKYTPDFCSRFRILKGGKISLVVSALVAGSTMTFASPTGGQVTSGSAAIAQNGSITTINQSSNKASINWSSFSIAPSETVNFVQPSASSVTLNRVIGTTQSLIQGAMNANGQVFLLNPNGVLFANGSQINVGGLVASTLNISDENFQAGNYLFEGNSQNSIINMGTITANNGYVAMMGKTVQNEGTIVATMGNVQMASGEKISLNLNGNSLVKLTIDQGTLNALVENKGLIQADGGQVYLTTQALNTILDGMVNNTGVIEAQSLNNVDGKVILYAHGGTANISGTIDATGGFVETSGKDLSVADGTIIKAKKWLLDPENVVIESGGTVSATTIATFLENPNASPTNQMEIQATGDITVNQALNILTDNVTVGGLTLIAGNDININNVITVGASANLTLNHGWDGTTAWDGSNEGTIYGNGGQITMGMTADKTAFTGKVSLGTTSAVYINEVEQIVIRDAAALQAIQSDLSGNYVLASNIDMTGIDFTPIGYNLNDNSDDYTREFKGNFNGLGNTVLNLTISTDYNWDDYGDNKATGLFGNVSGGAVISNIRLSNASVTNTAASNYGPMKVGGLVGYARGQYDTNNDFVAAPTIHNNIVTSSTITSNGWNVGGIVGGAEDNVVLSNNAVTSTTVTSSGKGYVGGIAGYVSGNVTIDNAYVANSIITAGGAEAAGAITGSLQRQSELTNSYAQTNTITAKRDAGGLVGIIEDFGDNYYNPATISNSFYKLDDTSINGSTGVITYGGIYATQYDAWLNANKTMTVAGLTADANGYYLINNSTDFKKMIAFAYDPVNNFKLASSFTLDAGLYMPVLMGTFDGNSKTLSELNVNQDYNANIGFVGRLLGGTVQNLTISGATLNGYANIGGIAGMMRGNTFVFDTGSTEWGSFTDGATITGSHVTGLNYNIDKTFDATWNAMDNGVSYDSIGGLVGTTQSKSVISNSDSAGSITMDIKSDGFSDYVGASSIGGLVGSAWGDDIAFDHVSSNVGINLKATALVANSNIGFESIGGLVGSMGGGDNTNAVLSNASASGAMSVTTKNYYDSITTNMNDYYIGDIGGLVGYLDGLDATTLSATNTITLKGDYIEYVGGIAGQSYDATYNGVTRSGAITINPADVTTNQNSEVYSVGGLIGYSENDMISHATAAGTITLGTAETPINYAQYIGGAFGIAYATNIDTTVSSVVIAASNVEEGSYFGGLVGENGGYTDDVYKNTYQTTFRSGDLTTQYTEAKTTYLARADVIALLAQGYELYDGSTDGSLNSTPYYDIDFRMEKYNVELGNISNSRASGNVIAPNVSNVGGLVGYNYLDGDIGAVITNSHASGEVQGLSDVGGLVGNNYGGNIVNSYATGKVTGTEENVGGLVGYNNGWDDQLWDSPSTTSSAIYDTPELAQAALDAYIADYIVAYEAAHPGYSQDYVGSNTYQMGGTNLYGYSIDMQYYKDVSVGTITDSHATGEVVGHGAYNIGGLVGHNYNDGDAGATITNSYATGAVKADGAESVGGLVGYNEYALIDSSYATGAVTANDSSPVGGLVGYDYEGTIANSHATGKVTVTNSGNAEKVGGLVGYTEFSSINGSYATGEVSAVGVDNVGGLVGEADNSHIETSYASSKVTGHDNVGGLVGFMLDSPTTILDSYAVGDVTGNDSVGGLVGLITDSTVTNTYASGAVTGTTNVGGLLGQVAGTTVNTSFYNSTKNPTVADNGFGTAKTTAEMNTLATYADAGWDIAEDSTLTKMFPQFGIGANIWVLNPVATIDPGTGVNVTPTPNNTVEQIQVNNVVTTIVNSTTVTPPAPVVVATVAPQPQQVQNQAQNNVLIQSIMPQGSTNGGSFGLVGSTDGITPVQTVTMEQLQTAATTQGIGEIRVPLANSSMVELVNGGVSLPVGVSQEFYVVASNDTLMDIEISNSNNKKAKK